MEQRGPDWDETLSWASCGDIYDFTVNKKPFGALKLLSPNILSSASYLPSLGSVE
jgi:hypothetical protein